MPTIAQDVAQIRTAVYGRDVREAIADGIEHCYSDISTAKTLADDSTSAANTAAGSANAAAASANAAAASANAAASNVQHVEDAWSSLAGITPIPVRETAKFINLTEETVSLDEHGVPVASGTHVDYVYRLAQASAGDKFTVNGQGGDRARLWGFVSADGTVLTTAAAQTSATNLVITAPADAAWVVIHTRDGRGACAGESLAVVADWAITTEDVGTVAEALIYLGINEAEVSA